MKNLLLTTVLALTLSLPFSAYAGVNIFGVDTPVVKKDVGNNVNAGYVAKHLGDTFHVQQLKNKNSLRNVEEKDQYLVFGVDLNSIGERI